MLFLLLCKLISINTSDNPSTTEYEELKKFELLEEKLSHKIEDSGVFEDDSLNPLHNTQISNNSKNIEEIDNTHKQNQNKKISKIPVRINDKNGVNKYCATCNAKCKKHKLDLNEIKSNDHLKKLKNKDLHIQKYKILQNRRSSDNSVYLQDKKKLLPFHCGPYKPDDTHLYHQIKQKENSMNSFDRLPNIGNKNRSRIPIRCGRINSKTKKDTINFDKSISLEDRIAKNKISNAPINLSTSLDFSSNSSNPNDFYIDDEFCEMRLKSESPLSDDLLNHSELFKDVGLCEESEIQSIFEESISDSNALKLKDNIQCNQNTYKLSEIELSDDCENRVGFENNFVNSAYQSLEDLELQQSSNRFDILPTIDEVSENQNLEINKKEKISIKNTSCFKSDHYISNEDESENKYQDDEGQIEIVKTVDSDYPSSTVNSIPNLNLKSPINDNCQDFNGSKIDRDNFIHKFLSDLKNEILEKYDQQIHIKTLRKTIFEALKERRARYDENPTETNINGQEYIDGIPKHRIDNLSDEVAEIIRFYLRSMDEFDTENICGEFVLNKPAKYSDYFKDNTKCGKRVSVEAIPAPSHRYFLENETVNLVENGMLRVKNRQDQDNSTQNVFIKNNIVNNIQQTFSQSNHETIINKGDLNQITENFVEIKQMVKDIVCTSEDVQKQMNNINSKRLNFTDRENKKIKQLESLNSSYYKSITDYCSTCNRINFRKDRENTIKKLSMIIQ